jgi:thiol-disulfide isomerase/thioredoxin
VETISVAGGLTSLAPDPASGLALRAALILVLLAAASAAWWVAHRHTSRFRPPPHHTLHVRAAAQEPRLTSADLSHELGTRGTFVQFSSATCATCPQVRRTLTEIAGSEPGVEHVDLASEDHMDLVRRFSVYRTPTVLLLDPDGAIHSRASGPLTPARALAALDQLPAPDHLPALDPLSYQRPRSINA